MHKFKVNGQLVPKIEWKQTDGETGGLTEATVGLLPAALTRSVETATCSRISVYSMRYPNVLTQDNLVPTSFVLLSRFSFQLPALLKHTIILNHRLVPRRLKPSLLATVIQASVHY